MFDVIKCCNILKKKLKELKIEVKVSILLKNINIKYGYCVNCNYAQAINIPKNKFLKSYYKNNSQWRRQLLTKEDKNHINKQIKFFSKYIDLTGKKHLEIGPDMGHFWNV